jgi:disulfide oxidoreductase YuzD
MPCNKKTKQKVMARVRRKYPNYSLKRRKKIASAIIYNKTKNKKRKRR